ncbi:hypothetical protein [Litorisediminicola beolgyonensis]|uniref:Uncharacterized protein n=1 Tax=Litorisediminicola beolgyonensis TaxID=1173614 RepID=A0ABW3ZGW4_9RHOB
MSTTIYDIEATGLEVTRDVPFQFGAHVLNSDHSLVRDLNLTGRLPRHVLPSPSALTVTGMKFSEIQKFPLSHHELVKRIHSFVVENSPTTFVSFNGMRYDENVLRHAFYSNLLQPYVTQLSGSMRMDVLKVVHAAVACGDGSIKVPLNEKGKKSFKLEGLARENGFNDHNAHDALGDVRATEFIMNLVRDKSPDVWRACERNRDKYQVQKMLESRRPLLKVDWNYFSGVPNVRVILPVVSDAENCNEWICVNLNCDVMKLLEKGEVSLKAAFKWCNGVTPLITVKTNDMPLVFDLSDPAIRKLPAHYPREVCEKILSDAGFASRLRVAGRLRKESYPPSESVWDDLYSGGFFPTSDDVPVIKRFHKVRPDEKFDLISDLSDGRARTLALWLIGSEWPDVLPHSARSEYEAGLREHLMAEEAKWTTIPSALRHIRELKVGARARDLEILEDYRYHLENMSSFA